MQSEGSGCARAPHKLYMLLANGGENYRPTLIDSNCRPLLLCWTGVSTIARRQAHATKTEILVTPFVCCSPHKRTHKRSDGSWLGVFMAKSLSHYRMCVCVCGWWLRCVLRKTQCGVVVIPNQSYSYNPLLPFRQILCVDTAKSFTSCRLNCRLAPQPVFHMGAIVKRGALHSFSLIYPQMK